MKKKLSLIGVLFIILIIILSQFGFEIGNLRIGKQVDLHTKQNKNFKQSNFYRNYYSKDKLVILNLWATWCKPCIAEIPMLNKVKEKYSKINVEFISLSIDTDSVKLVNFNNKKIFKFNDITLIDLKYRNAIINTLENKKADNWISSTSVPVTYFIKNNKVITKIEGQIEKDELIEQIEKLKT